MLTDVYFGGKIAHFTPAPPDRTLTPSHVIRLAGLSSARGWGHHDSIECPKSGVCKSNSTNLNRKIVCDRARKAITAAPTLACGWLPMLALPSAPQILAMVIVLGAISIGARAKTLVLESQTVTFIACRVAVQDGSACGSSSSARFLSCACCSDCSRLSRKKTGRSARARRG